MIEQQVAPEQDLVTPASDVRHCRGCSRPSGCRPTAGWPWPWSAAPSRTACGRSPWSGRSSGSEAVRRSSRSSRPRVRWASCCPPCWRCRGRPGAAEADRDVGGDGRVRLLHGDRRALAGRGDPAVAPRARALCLGMGMAFYYAAYSAWLPAIVPASELQAVNGFEGMVRPLVGRGDRARRGRRRGRAHQPRHGHPGRGRGRRSSASCADRPAPDAGAARPRRRRRSPGPGRAGGHPRGRGLHGAHAAGCWPRCCSPR